MKNQSSAKIDFARTLRHQPTKGEHRIWLHIRNRRCGGLKFRRQHAIGPNIVDFACIETKLIVELDGPSHEGRLDYDARRTSYLERLGFRVLRFAAEDVAENLSGTLDTIHAVALEQQKVAAKQP